ncbi:MAG: hypothetical protein C0P79_006995 [Gammaproteobacteria bacterium]|nr:hypothetical protein [Gammaproteobacteria bacterium]
MLLWFLGLVIALVIWAQIWKTNPTMAFGILIGLPIAWVASKLITPYLTGVAPVPVWLPPLPFAIVAVTLFVFGVLVWIRGTRAERQRVREEHRTE